MDRYGSKLSTLGVILGLLAGGSSPVAAETDADIFARIDTLLPAAQAISIDGDLSDWSGFQFFDDPIGDAGGDGSRDLSSIAMAPLDQEILFGLATLGAPAAGSIFSLVVDLAGDSFPELVLLLDSVTNFHTLLVIDPDNNIIASGIVAGIELALGAQAIEVRVPYAALVPILPASLAADMQPANHRSWVRARADSSLNPGVTLDFTPSYGSYRLLPTPYPLDPPLQTVGISNPFVAPQAMDFPMDGQWFLGQGPDGLTTHAGAWAYDWVQINEFFERSDPPLSSVNNDYFGFGAQAFAPIAGMVTSAIGIHPDQPPGIRGPVNNEVLIDTGDGWQTRLFHFKQNSVTAFVGQNVVPGEPIAEVGNSGFSSETHLHIDVVGPGGSRRIAFEAVEVSLNAREDDPWRRFVESWEPRTGFLVALPEPSFALSLGAGCGLLAALRRRRAHKPLPTC